MSKAAKDEDYSGSDSKLDDQDEMYNADSKFNEDQSYSSPAKAEKQAEPSKLDDVEILEKLQQYFYEDETLANHFENFINNHSHIVDLNSEEYKLEYTKVFNEYKDLFETKLEDVIEKILKVSVTDVYRALKMKVDAPEETMESFFAQVLIAVTDFDVFMSMMRDSARNANHK